jgi:hypothetical protein
MKRWALPMAAVLVVLVGAGIAAVRRPRRPA